MATTTKKTAKPTAKKAAKVRKLEPVEVDLQRGDDHDGACFVIYNKFTNRERFRSRFYTRRSSAKRGAIRKAAAEGWKISRWLK